MSIPKACLQVSRYGVGLFQLALQWTSGGGARTGAPANHRAQGDKLGIPT
jgi:hypothetical protein